MNSSFNYSKQVLRLKAGLTSRAEQAPHACSRDTKRPTGPSITLQAQLSWYLSPLLFKVEGSENYQITGKTIIKVGLSGKNHKLKPPR